MDLNSYVESESEQVMAMQADTSQNICEPEDPISRRRTKRNVKKVELDANTSAWLTSANAVPPEKSPKKVSLDSDKAARHQKKSRRSKSKWLTYYRKIDRELQQLQLSRSENKLEFMDGKVVCSDSDGKIIKKIMEILKHLEAENRTHKRHPEFAGPGEEFNVENITCSKCNGMDSEHDDLYFCDAQGCCRAYHLRCLDPPVLSSSISTNPDEDWFCNQCRCAGDCLVLINQSLGSYFQNVPELREALGGAGTAEPHSDSEDSLDEWATSIPHKESLELEQEKSDRGGTDTVAKRPRGRPKLKTAAATPGLKSKKKTDKKSELETKKGRKKSDTSKHKEPPRSPLPSTSQVDDAPPETEFTPIKTVPSTISQQLLEDEQGGEPRSLTHDNYFVYGDGVTQTHWHTCFKKITKHVLDIHKLSHLIDVLSANGHNDGVLLSAELLSTIKKSDKSKLAVREWLQAIVEPNKVHRRYTELDDVGDDGMVEVDAVNCSKCGLPDDDGNDILFCDRKGCCRAYHAGCLDPPADPRFISSDPEDDWFCWECRCVADSLALINEMCGTNYEDGVDEVFAELLEPEELESGGLLNDVEAWGGDSSSEDDDDYMPKSNRASKQQNKKSQRRDEEEASGSPDHDEVEAEVVSDSGSDSDVDGSDNDSDSDNEVDDSEGNRGLDEDGDCDPHDDDNEDPRDDLDSELSGNEVSVAFLIMISSTDHRVCLLCSI
jgi:hypothetical protein